MRLRRLIPALAAAAALAAAGCSNDLDVTNTNQRTATTFWATSNDAVQGVNAVYNGLYQLGVYGRWQTFLGDLRADDATARTSPWGDLANYGGFQINDYNWEINGHAWNHTYTTIYRANQAIAAIPGITAMDAGMRNRLVAEAKTLRAQLYFNLVNYFGGNIPLILEPISDPLQRPGSSTTAAVYAQIEKDLTEAIPNLPRRTQQAAGDAGRVTQGYAQGLLGKTLLQQRKWAQASTALATVIASNDYGLLANYQENFTDANENNRESLFEVQMSDESTLPLGIPGLSFPRMSGPCAGATFCDVRPTRWYFRQFFLDSTTTGGLDPRLNATIVWNQPGSTEVLWTRPISAYFSGASDSTLYFRKYGEWYKTGADFQRWDNPINFRVLRYADVLLMQAEALNEQGQPANAVALVNQVRRRVNLRDLPANISQADLRERIQRERLLELGLEGQRFFDLVRWGLLNDAAGINLLKTRDNDFDTFRVGITQVLPIPRSETNINSNVNQNTGY